ncbi:menaquinone-dependent protoporphyrinogen IX dehydrogenase [Ramlibacter sp.]|uniref:menaquinone-dependent protoporphyrinogen IX dehydrogenase n=1 Tax=Ramlibacter sp. TaxID=1917967 RepID=UPI002CA5AEFC|nr:menaquinone-dependent protoporphyrinogen IX dehydrogenase [Ramlibacter sp.]HWI83306.1 menaquinone-dependent protoporphyrinogen IX dehydrogenase [Ramlibacter sp.]
MAHILILYSTTDGQTLKICRHLQQQLEAQAHRVTLRCVDEEPEIDLAPYDKVVVGARIRYGKHTPQVFEFARAHRAALDARPNAFFTVNVVARKPEKNTPETNPYMRQFLARSAWRPKALAVFAGRIDYKRYRFWDRQVIRFIMWLTKGPTAPDTDVEFTDWNKVEAFGRLVAAM